MATRRAHTEPQQPRRLASPLPQPLNNLHNWTSLPDPPAAACIATKHDCPDMLTSHSNNSIGLQAEALSILLHLIRLLPLLICMTCMHTACLTHQHTLQQLKSFLHPAYDGLSRLIPDQHIPGVQDEWAINQTRVQLATSLPSQPRLSNAAHMGCPTLSSK